jgi:hypothetical protein
LSFQAILRETLQQIDGGIGAVFLDHEGESVDLWAERPFDIGADGLKAIGAYQGIYISELKRLGARADIGQPRRFTTHFESAMVLSCDLADGYYLVVILDPSTNEGLAWRRVESCRERLLAEIQS